MGRYTGPRCRQCRREGVKLFLKGDRCATAKCAIERRKTVPGMHGAFSVRSRLSQYGLRLREKQKAKRIYGILEKQFRRYFEQAKQTGGNTGFTLVKLLESRLDSVVYAVGFGSSRQLARQLVSHGQVKVNGKRVTIASFHVKEGDAITVIPKATGTQQTQIIKETLKKKKEIPAWLSIAPDTLEAKVVRQPQQKDLPSNINTQYIIEYYSR